MFPTGADAPEIGARRGQSGFVRDRAPGPTGRRPVTAVDVLVVGAGPTGLAMAAQLAAFGVPVRVVDRAVDRAHESRALAIQPRTLEVLAGLGVTDELLAGGNPAVRLCLHAHGGVRAVPLFDLGLADTAYPHLLFLSRRRPNASWASTWRRRGSASSGASSWWG